MTTLNSTKLKLFLNVCEFQIKAWYDWETQIQWGLWLHKIYGGTDARDTSITGAGEKERRMKRPNGFCMERLGFVRFAETKYRVGGFPAVYVIVTCKPSPSRSVFLQETAAFPKPVWISKPRPHRPLMLMQMSFHFLNNNHISSPHPHIIIGTVNY